jgi:hypothetical protein
LSELTMPSRSCSLAALTLCGSLAACNDPPPPTPAEVRSQLTSDLGRVLREAQSAFTGSQGALPIAMPLSAPSVDPDATVAYLNDHVFTDANAAGDGMFRLTADVLCAPADATCAAQVAELAPQLRTSKDGDALVIGLELDADHDEPVHLTLSHDSLAVSVDLDAAQRALGAVASALGDAAPNLSLAGALTARIDILATAKAQAALTIDRALAIAGAPAGAALTGDAAFQLRSAAGEVIAISLDGNAKSGALTTGLGETTIALPAIGGKRIALDLAGLASAATFAAGQPLALTHLGLGARTSQLTVNGAVAAAIDLNPDNGRALDVTVSRDAAAATTTFAVAPALDLRLALDHGVLGDTAPVYDVTRVAVTGSVRRHDATGVLEVLSGDLAISTNPASFGVTAHPGQCVTSASADDPTSGQAFAQWTVAACQ